MTIAICGSMKFVDKMTKIKGQLGKAGHQVFVPDAIEKINYWSEDGSEKVEAKKVLNLINKHLDKIDDSDAILVVNVTKKEIENYIGANSFLEIGYAYRRKKKIFLLNPVPNQPYILDEILAMEPIILDGNLDQIN